MLSVDILEGERRNKSTLPVLLVGGVEEIKVAGMYKENY